MKKEYGEVNQEKNKRKKKRGGEGGEMSCLRGSAVRHLPQDDDTSALGGPDLLSTGRHLQVRQCWWPTRRENGDESRTLVNECWSTTSFQGQLGTKKSEAIFNSHLTMSEISSRLLLMFLILSRLARVWMDTYWSASIWEVR